MRGLWTVLLGPQQNTEQAGNSQAGAFGGGAAVALIEQDQVGSQFQCECDRLGLTGIESCLKKPSNAICRQRLRLNPAHLERLLNLLQSISVPKPVQFAFDSVRNPKLAELRSEELESTYDGEVADG